MRFVCARNRPTVVWPAKVASEVGRLLAAHEAQWSGNEYYSGTEEKLYFSLALILWAPGPPLTPPPIEVTAAAGGGAASGLPAQLWAAEVVEDGWACPAPGGFESCGAASRPSGFKFY